MKPLTVQLADDVYERAVLRAAQRGEVLPKEVADFVKRYGEGTSQAPATTQQMEADEVKVAAARARMAELFRTVTGFRFAPRIPREELYERGSLH